MNVQIPAPRLRLGLFLEADITLEVTVATQEDGQAVKDHIPRADRITSRGKGLGVENSNKLRKRGKDLQPRRQLGAEATDEKGSYVWPSGDYGSKLMGFDGLGWPTNIAVSQPRVRY